MQKPEELTGDELDCVSGGSDAVSDFVNWLLNQLHIPSSPGGPISEISPARFVTIKLPELKYSMRGLQKRTSHFSFRGTAPGWTVSRKVIWIT